MTSRCSAQRRRSSSTCRCSAEPGHVGRPAGAEVGAQQDGPPRHRRAVARGDPGDLGGAQVREGAGEVVEEADGLPGGRGGRGPGPGVGPVQAEGGLHEAQAVHAPPHLVADEEGGHAKRTAPRHLGGGVEQGLLDRRVIEDRKVEAEAPGHLGEHGAVRQVAPLDPVGLVQGERQRGPGGVGGGDAEPHRLHRALGVPRMGAQRDPEEVRGAQDVLGPQGHLRGGPGGRRHLGRVMVAEQAPQQDRHPAHGDPALRGEGLHPGGGHVGVWADDVVGEGQHGVLDIASGGRAPLSKGRRRGGPFPRIESMRSLTRRASLRNGEQRPLRSRPTIPPHPAPGTPCSPRI